MTTRDLKFAGDVQINKIVLTSLNGQTANIQNQVVSIEIYEDLLSPFTTLSIVVKDSIDYINLFPFIGEEYLDIDIATPGLDSSHNIRGKFYIYKIADRIYSKDREVLYTIKAASEEFLTNTNVKINKPLDGKISDIAAKVLVSDGLKTKKQINIEETKNKTKLISNFWDPIRCMNELCERAISKTNSPSYMFFENRTGYNFKSIDSLLTQKTYANFIKDNYSRKEEGTLTGSVKNPTEDFKRIIDIDVPLLYDYIDDAKSGQLKSRMITYDLVTKKYAVKDYSVKTDPKPFTLLNKSYPYSRYAIANPSAKTIVVPKYYGVFDGYSDVGSSAIVQRRMSFFKNLEKHKIEIEVIGRTDYTVGLIVDLELPKIAQITKDEKEKRDMMLSGRYLVSAITHYINRSNHVCKVELIKNSVLFDMEKA